VTILYFAWVRQKLGTGEECVNLPATVKTVGELAEYLRVRGGAFTEVFCDLRRLRAAVNQEHVGWDTPVRPNDEIAFFPPVTGG